MKSGSSGVRAAGGRTHGSTGRASILRFGARLPSRDSPLWLAPILALALALRWLRIGANSLWFDEAFSWLVARQPPRAILTERLAPILPPLYHVLLSFWLRLGESEALLRGFSAACGILTIPVLYCLGRRLFTPQAGLVAALLTAALPFQIYYSQEARPYALVILLSALILAAFVRAWQCASLGRWLLLGLLAGLGIYAHYFVAFSLATLHGFVLLQRPAGRQRWRGLLVADLVALLVIAPQMSSALAQTRQVMASFWLTPPSPVQPIKTLDYLLFGHTSPAWLVPVALFFSLSVFVLAAWSAFRTRGEARAWLALLVALVLAPMVVVLALSWISSPIYLERSFSLVTPAYVLLLGWALAHPPKGSPLRLLFGGLAIVAIISLVHHYGKLDPAKPPFREVAAVIESGWQEQDTVLNLHDSSYLPQRYYAPELDSTLLNNDPTSWVPATTWEWAGRRVSDVEEAISGKARLWLLVMPFRLDERQSEVLSQLEARYEAEGVWRWPSAEPVELRLYWLTR